MFRFRFKCNPASDPDVHPRLKRQLPRLLALSVPLAVTVKVMDAAANGRRLGGPGPARRPSPGPRRFVTGLYVYRRRKLGAPATPRPSSHSLKPKSNATCSSSPPCGPPRGAPLWSLMAANLVCLLLALYAPLYMIGAAGAVAAGTRTHCRHRQLAGVPRQSPRGADLDDFLPCGPFVWSPFNDKPRGPADAPQSLARISSAARGPIAPGTLRKSPFALWRNRQLLRCLVERARRHSSPAAMPCRS